MVTDFNQRTPRRPGEATWMMARDHMLKGGKVRRQVWWDSWLVKIGAVTSWTWANPDKELVAKTPDRSYTPWPLDMEANDWVLE